MNGGRLDNIQILRGIAACLIVFVHASGRVQDRILDGWLLVGFSGVDLFFVLSGFIILYVSYEHLGSKEYFSYFLSRRLIRVYPIHLVIAMAILIIFPIVIQNKSLDLLGIFRSLMLYPTPTKFHINPPTWTLSHELIFYLIFSSAFWLRRSHFIALMAVWLSGIILYSQWRFTGDFAVKTLLSTKNYTFFYGCVIAYVVKNDLLPRSRSLAAGLVLAGTGFLLWTRASHPELDSFLALVQLRHLYFGIPCAAIVLGAVLLKAGPSRSPKRFLLLVGDASYSIYLIHPLIMNILMTKVKLGTMGNYVFVFLTLTISAIAAGLLAYLWIEKPLLQWLYARSPWHKPGMENLPSIHGRAQESLP